MANQNKVNDVAAKSGRRARSAAAGKSSETCRAADGARFLFKGQCYDAGPASDTTCSLCGERIRLVYVLKVIEFPSHPCAQEVGKLNCGECCFKAIETVNEKLYRQLLAGAVNLRTYIEAIERDQRIFGDRQDTVAPEKVRLLRPGVLGVEEDLVQQLFEAFLSDGGEHA
jgi:hypothetical protein